MKTPKRRFHSYFLLAYAYIHFITVYKKKQIHPVAYWDVIISNYGVLWECHIYLFKYRLAHYVNSKKHIHTHAVVYISKQEQKSSTTAWWQRFKVKSKESSRSELWQQQTSFASSQINWPSQPRPAQIASEPSKM